MRRFRYIMTAVAMLLAFVSCEDDDPAAPAADAPQMITSSPENGAAGLTAASLTVTVTMDQNVFCPTSERSRISAGEATIDKIYATNATVSVDVSGLERGKSYTLTFPKGTISGYKDNPAGDVSVSWSMKDPDRHYEMNPAGSLHDASATSEAKDLYSYLLGVYGKKTLSGAMGGTAWTTQFTDYIYNFSGKYPAIVGFDYLFLDWPPKAWSTCPDYGDISVVKGAYQAGNIIQIGWHWSVPQFAGATPNDYSFNKKAFTVTNALTPGRWEHDTLELQIKKLAGYMKLLQDAKIPVLFRPLHEAAGDYGWGAWFWWGYDGAEKCVELWKYLHEKLTVTYGLHNLIWVWTVQTSNCGSLAKVEQLEEWYPGDEYVDIVGADLYEQGGTSQSDRFQLVLDSVKGKKMVALSECGALLDPDKYMAEGAPWLYFLGWEDTMPLSSSTNKWNTEDSWTKCLGNPYIINRK